MIEVLDNVGSVAAVVIDLNTNECQYFIDPLDLIKNNRILW